MRNSFTQEMHLNSFKAMHYYSYQSEIEVSNMQLTFPHLQNAYAIAIP